MGTGPYDRPVRILRLTNSSDIQDSVPPDLRASAVAERVVAEATGEPVETIVRVFWPDDGLPDVVERWIDRYQPDIFFMRASAFWCSYASVPLRLQRLLPFIGKPLGDVGVWAAGSRWGESRAFRAARQLAVRTIGGDYNFEPAHVTATVEAAYRRVLSHEAVVPALRGPGFARDSSGSRSGGRRAQARNAALDSALAAMSLRLHIPYAAHDQAVEPGHLARDAFHTNAHGLRLQGELEGALIARAWLAAHPH